MPEKLVLKTQGKEYLPMTAGRIIESLELRHCKDVFVPECKTGQSWGGDYFRMDAWAMPRSYSPLRTIGYEVKVDRSDFENDQKWVQYLDYCHMFFFVCPAGLIRSDDLPKGVGLIWVSQSGRLHIKKHAEKHIPDMEKLNNLLTYIVMARSVIAANMYQRDNAIPVDRLTYIKEATERAKERSVLAYFVKGHVQEEYEKIKQLERELIRRESHMSEFANKLQKLNITWDTTKEDWNNIYEVNAKIAHLKKDVDDGFIYELASLGERLTNTAKKLKELNA